MGEQQEVKLHGMWRSPFSRRVEVALKLKGIPYDYVHEDLPNKSPDLLKYNPIYKKVPVLLHNDKPIVESQIILEYIDETWPTGYSILPPDPYAHAMARFWAKLIDDKCLPAEAATKEMLTKEKYPSLYNWAQEYPTLNVFKNNLPPRDVLVDYFKTRIQASKASK